MQKPEKTAKLDGIVVRGAVVRLKETSAEMVDQDELQLMDELNKKWVGAWRKEVNKKARTNKKVVRAHFPL